MDKNKNRTDLLAAGRKKLQQYRKKKDKKGGSSSSLAKSSGKSSTSDNDVDPEEPSKFSEPKLGTDTVDPITNILPPSITTSSLPSTEHKGDLKELPSITLGHPDTNYLGLQECNGERIESRNDDIDNRIDSGGSIEEAATLIQEDIILNMPEGETSAEKYMETPTSPKDVSSTNAEVNDSLNQDIRISTGFLRSDSKNDQVGYEQANSVDGSDETKEIASREEAQPNPFHKVEEENSSSEKTINIPEDDGENVQQPSRKIISPNETPHEISNIETHTTTHSEDDNCSPRGEINYAIHDKEMDVAMLVEKKEHAHLCTSSSELESIRQLLYITNIEKNIIQLQLNEQTAIHADNEQKSADEVSELRYLLKESLTSKSVLDKELEECRSQFEAITVENNELKNICLSSEYEMEELRNRSNNLQNLCRQSQEELSRVLVELADCKVSLETAQKENLELAKSFISTSSDRLSTENNKLSSEVAGQKEQSVLELDKYLHLQTGFDQLAEENIYLAYNIQVSEEMLKELAESRLEIALNLISTKDAAEKLMEEKELFSRQTNKLTSELAEQKEQLVLEHDNYLQLQTSFDQLSEENLYLAYNLEIIEEKLKELIVRQLEVPSLLKGSKNQEHGDTNVLKKHLNYAFNLLYNLESTIGDMHSHTVSLIKPGGRLAAPGISKIIQAFESKAHHAEITPDEVPAFTEGGHLDDSFALMKEQTHILKNILNQMKLELGEPNMNYNYNMELETENQPSIFVQKRIDEILQKLSVYELKTINIQNHISNMQQNVNDETTRLLSQIEILQGEANDKISTCKLHENTLKGVISGAVQKLSCLGMQIDDGLGDTFSITPLVDAVVLEINNLHEKIEAYNHKYGSLQISFEELSKLFTLEQEKNVTAFEVLKIMNNSLQGEPVDDLTIDELQLIPTHLQKLIKEHHQLISRNNELAVQLSNRNSEIQELNFKYETLLKMIGDECQTKQELESILAEKEEAYEKVTSRIFLLAQKLENGDIFKEFDGASMVLKSDGLESDTCTSTLLRTEAFVDFLLEKYMEVTEQINLSKICLQEVDIMIEDSAGNFSLPIHILLRTQLMPMVNELKEKLQLLTASNNHQETETQHLKHDLTKMEENLQASNSELNLKVSELEQSEQRLSSVREKLSIAVAKGKGLIVQRDNLKQTLIEKSSELQNCLQELRAKESLLHEAEAKLKSCSEADRVESLESELSYIRDSATALRDSFLLKDSSLQKIEEVLEDLDLPEHFHSKDIVEKVELLCRFVSSNSSLSMTDFDQKCSEDIVVVDSRNDEMLTNSNQNFDELKTKYDELKSNLYGLAEHNDMLEQSLHERNSLLKRWEEMLDRIDMPSHLRTLEPEEKIDSLGREFSAIQQDRDALHLKIENLEVSSDMLIVDLEESHKKISELTAEVVAVKSDKDFFSESLDKLRFQYLALSEKTVHDEVERENLQREITDLQEKMNEKAEYYHVIENEIQQLHDLILNVFPDAIMSESHVSIIASLEALVRKLIDNYTVLLAEKSMYISHNEGHIDEIKQSAHISSNKGTEQHTLNLEQDEASQLVKEERDAATAKCHHLTAQIEEITQKMKLMQEMRVQDTEKCHSLTLEVEEITQRLNSLQKERTQDMEKYQSLVSKLEAADKQTSALQELLTQEEQKCASAREKLNVAVRKGKGLVQQRDALKQTIEEMNTMAEHSKNENKQRIETLESEKASLINQLHAYSQKMNRLLAAIQSIEYGHEVSITDPIQKIQKLVETNRDLHNALISSQKEAMTSKQANELLVAELNEVQDRVDILEENLDKTDTALKESYKEKHEADAAKLDAVSRFEQLKSIHFRERKKQIENLTELNSGIDHLRKGYTGFSSLLSISLSKDMDLFSYVQTFMKSISKLSDGENMASLALSRSSTNPPNMETSNDYNVIWQHKIEMDSSSSDNLIAERLAYACNNIHECSREFHNLKEKLNQHISYIHQQETLLSETMVSIKRNIESQKYHSESLKQEVANLELVIRENNNQISSMHRNISLLYEACRCSITAIEDKKGGPVSDNSSRVTSFPVYDEVKDRADMDQSIKTIAGSLLPLIQRSNSIDEKELKTNISDLCRELQEKDIEMKRVTDEFISQIKEAEDNANRYLLDLDSSRNQVLSLEKQVTEMEDEKQLLELRINKFKEDEVSSQSLQERLKFLSDLLAAKDQEIEGLKCGLIQALDEEESKTEALENKNTELEDLLEENIQQMKILDASKAKALAKLSTTVEKFDELHNLSEHLLEEIESLQSQLKERDSEISFLRQEVTRCTNNDLASQEANKMYLSELSNILRWMETTISQLGGSHTQTNDENCSQSHLYTDIIDKRISLLMNELNDIRLTAQSKETLLQTERDRVKELLRKTGNVDILHNEKVQRGSVERESGCASSSSSPRHVEIEQMVQRNKASASPIATHTRSGRKVNNDQIAISIDAEKDDDMLDDEDDDKAHGFKSLTMSRLVPRVTRPISDRIDGIWVSAERLLMRQPTLRLGVIMYWVLLHALLASII